LRGPCLPAHQITEIFLNLGEPDSAWCSHQWYTMGWTWSCLIQPDTAWYTMGWNLIGPDTRVRPDQANWDFPIY
jgi:hypothetical protein